MTFDLHMHSQFSDGQLTPETAELYLSNHCDYRTVTDHDNADFHRKFPNFCSFTGMEITSFFMSQYRKEFAELLLFGYDPSHPVFKLIENRRQSGSPLLSVQELCVALEPVRKQGALLFLAHPPFTYQLEERREEILSDLLPFVDGYECLHLAFNRRSGEVPWMLEFCKRHGKFATGGSDSHSIPPHTTPFLEYVVQYKELFSWIPDLAQRKG